MVGLVPSEEEEERQELSTSTMSGHSKKAAIYKPGGPH